MKRTIVLFCANLADQKPALLEKAKQEGWKVEEALDGVKIHAEMEVTAEQAAAIDKADAFGTPPPRPQLPDLKKIFNEIGGPPVVRPAPFAKKIQYDTPCSAIEPVHQPFYKRRIKRNGR